jgi:predicted ATPase
MAVATNSITLKGWKGFAVEDVPLWPVTLLLGPNGSGKSSLLEALSLVAHLGRRGSLREDLRPWLRGWPDGVFTRCGDGSVASEATIHLRWSGASYRLTLGRPEKPEIRSEHLVVRDTDFIRTKRDGRRIFTAGTSGRPLEPSDEAEAALGLVLRGAGRRKAPRPLVDLLTRIETYALDADFLRGTAIDTRPAPYQRKGASLVSGLLDLHGSTGWAAFETALRAVQPDLASVEVVARPRGVLLAYSDGREIQLDEESDGLVRAAGMFLVRYRLDCPAILAFDEPENGFHLSRLVDVVSRLAPDANARSRNPRLVILATHSPGLVKAAAAVLGRRCGALTLWRAADGRVLVNPWPGEDLAVQENLDLALADGFASR